MKRILDKFFYPNSVAVVGATEKPEKISYAVVRNLLAGGFKGAVYPVNPKHQTVQGLKCFARLKDLPEKPDLVVFALPAALIPPLMKDCKQAKVECAVVLSAGFKEAGPAGEALFRDLKREAATHGVHLIGPNCLGLVTPSIGLNATFAPMMPPAGRVAFISQSGALGSAILDWAADKNVGFSHFVSVGRIADMLRRYPHVRAALPAVGYSDQETRDLEETVRRVPADSVLIATPTDLSHVVRIEKPWTRARYELADMAPPALADIVSDWLASARTEAT